VSAGSERVSKQEGNSEWFPEFLISLDIYAVNFRNPMSKRNGRLHFDP